MTGKNTQKDEKANGWIYPVILLVLGGLIYFYMLGGMALWDTDEALYTQIAREMEQTGDYLSTQWNRIPWFCHPPLYFWLTIASAKIFGWNAFAARFPSALFGVLTVLLTYLFGCRLYNRKAGFYAGLATLATFQLWLQSRMAILDMPFLFFIILAVYLFYRGFTTKRPSWYYVGFWVCCGFAVLTKGPVGVILPLIYVGFAILFKKRWDEIGKLLTSPGISFLIIIGAPWYMIMAKVYGGPFIDQVFDYFFITRIFKPVMNQGGPWYYYVPYFLAGFLPWTVFLPMIFFALGKRRGDFRSQFLLAWIISTFLIFTLAGTKRPNYILFLYPALSIALGWVMDEAIDRNRFRRMFHFSFSAFSLSVLLVIAAFGYTAVWHYPHYWKQYNANLTPLGVALVIGGVVTFLMAFKKKAYAFYSVVALTMVCFMMLVSYIPLVESLRPEPRIAESVKQIITPGDRLAMRGNFGRQFSILFYVNKPVDFYHTDEDLVNAVNTGRGYVIIMHRKNFERLRGEFKVDVEIIKRDGGLVLFRAGKNKQNMHGGNNR